MKITNAMSHPTENTGAVKVIDYPSAPRESPLERKEARRPSTKDIGGQTPLPTS